MNGLDLDALRGWLARRSPGESLRRAEPIAGGQSNPTWKLVTDRRRLALRKKPEGPILKGAHAIEREFRVLQALAGTEVPVPEALWLEEDAQVLGTPFYVMAWLDGRVFTDSTLPGMTPAERRGIYFAMARSLARLHAVRPETVGLGDYGKPGSYFERQLRRWSGQYDASEMPRIAALDRVAAWLDANMPEEDGAAAIAHGDFRLGNLMVHPEEPKVIGILDWELSTLGHPLADLGFCVMPWTTGHDEYGGLIGTDWETAGIPTRAEFVAEYRRHAPPTPPLRPFHMVFALFRFAVIFIGIAERARAGSAAADNAASLAPLAERFAVRATEIIDAEADGAGPRLG
ncbi:phosphotransferase family protein [Psychromarinibacter sp. C21-152]|uniref:Phosphotransferase family protein n=1 Tax=Psychromarinibacter sediminicola TaxID=3033385 RepID=A0AAE3NS88_9RHOB|nr:phosphotransferase family protein [Psychromarinibacter sediminicola]MDF0599597.1 phosphotransferase family protein [Psychromarinibacter sediminicola]